MTNPTIPQPSQHPQNPGTPSGSPIEGLLREAAIEGLELADLGARIFETGIESPGADPGIAFLRDALRCAQVDLDLLGAALEHVAPETAARAAMRADNQITFALALYAFLERYRGPLEVLVQGDAEPKNGDDNAEPSAGPEGSEQLESSL